MSTLTSGSVPTGSIVKCVRLLMLPLSIQPESMSLAILFLICPLSAAVPTLHVSVLGSHFAAAVSADAGVADSDASAPSSDARPIRAMDLLEVNMVGRSLYR